MSRLLQNIIILIVASAVLAKNETERFVTTSSTESETFAWTIKRFTFLSSAFPLTSPAFNICYVRDYFGEKESVCASWNAVVKSSTAEHKYLDLELVLQDSQYYEPFTYINAQLLDNNGKVIRQNYEWRSTYYMFNFLWEGEHSLNHLDEDTLVIKWEMVRLDPTKDIITERIGGGNSTGTN